MTREVVQIPCGRRGCEFCSVGWARYHVARLLSGTVGVEPERMRFWTVTAPAEVEDVEGWNRSVLERFRFVWRAFRTRYGAAESYYGVKEYQERGLLHLHLLLRLSEDYIVPRGDFGAGGWLEGVLVAHGFGQMHRLVRVDRRRGGAKGAASYLSKYLLKSAHYQQLSKGSHVDFWARDWSLVWHQHRRDGGATSWVSTDGSGSVSRWRFGWRNGALVMTNGAASEGARPEAASGLGPARAP